MIKNLCNIYIYIEYTICMKFISFFIHNINSIKMKKNIFLSDTKKYPNIIEFFLII